MVQLLLALGLVASVHILKLSIVLTYVVNSYVEVIFTQMHRLVYFYLAWIILWGFFGLVFSLFDLKNRLVSIIYFCLLRLAIDNEKLLGLYRGDQWRRTLIVIKVVI